MAKSQTELMMQNTSYPHGQEIQSKQKLSTEHMKQVNAGWKLKFGLEWGRRFGSGAIGGCMF